MAERTRSNSHRGGRGFLYVDLEDERPPRSIRLPQEVLLASIDHLYNKRQAQLLYSFFSSCVPRTNNLRIPLER
jgi:hypothetical protein